MRVLQFLLLRSLFLAHAATLFSHAQTFQELYPNPLSHGGQVAWADYDADGDPDLVTSGVLKGGVGKTILYRNDNRSFVIDQEFDGPTGRIQWMDLDDDGDLDLILGSSKIQIRINDNGIFVNQPRVDAYQFQVWTDYNNDKDPDMFALSFHDIVKFYKENGRLLETRVTSVRSARSINVGDYNNDGLYDFLIQYEPEDGSDIFLLMNNGNGYFARDLQNTFADITYATLNSFDVDDDGDTDILLTGKVSGEDSATGYLYLNEGGTFTLSSDPFFQSGQVHPQKINSDDKVDICKFSGGTLLYYENLGAGQYEQTPMPFNDYTWMLNLEYASAQGEPDDSYLCVSGTLTNGNWSTRIYHRTDGGYEQLYPNPLDQVSNSQLMRWTDYNNDGLLDAFASGRSQSGKEFARLLKNNGSGLEPVFDFPTAQTGKGDWVDFNKDGDIDFITVTERQVLLYEGFDGPGPVTSKVLLTNVDEGAFPKVIDFDKDGDHDIFIDGYFEGLYVNDNNVFTKSITFGDWYSWTGKSDWADYDADGDDDVLLYVDAGSMRSTIRLYRNEGRDFTMIDYPNFPSMEGAHVRWLDYDADGDLDVFALELHYLGKVIPRLYKNNDQSFVMESAAVFSDLERADWYIAKIAITDINNDGYPDIVVGTENSEAPELMMYLNNNGTFQLNRDHDLPALRWMNFDWGDFDNDTDPDLLVSGYGDDITTQVYLNTTVDRYPPIIKSLSPANRHPLVRDDGYKLLVQFHEKVTKGNAAIRLYRKDDASLIYEVNASDESVTINGDAAEIMIDQDPFSNGEEIFILIEEDAFRDTNNNPFKGLSDPERWNVTVENNKQRQTITFSVSHTVYVTDVPFELTGTSSSGEPLTYTSSNPLAATVSGSLVTVTGVGATILTAFQAGNEFFNAATPVQRELTVKKGIQTITFDPIPEKTLADEPFTLNASSSSGLPVTFNATDPLIASIEGNMITILGAGETVITARQPGDDMFAEASPQSQLLVVTAITALEQGQDRISIYPNPAKESIRLPFAGSKLTTGYVPSFKVYDSRGVLVLKGVASDHPDENIPVWHLLSGIYYIRVDQGPSIWHGRFMKL